MKIHTTNYFNTFIQIADDCPINKGEVPPEKSNDKSVAQLQFKIIIQNPYKFTSDDVLYQVLVLKNEGKIDFNTKREEYFSKGQPCFRASPLTKRYGWGVHYDKDGKMAIFGSESEEYKKFSIDSSLKILKAMKSSE